MKLKKILLSVGSLAAIVTPISAVVSCGEPSSSQYSESDLLTISNLKSSEAHAKLQNLWLSKVLISEYGIVGKSQLEFLKDINNTGDEFKTDFENTLKWVLKDKLFASKDALTTIYKAIKTSDAPETIVGTEDGTGGVAAFSALNTKVFVKSDIESSVDKIFDANSKWEDVFFNYGYGPDDDGGGDDAVVYNPSILGIKDLVLKMLVTKKYLSITSSDFNKAMPSEYIKLADKFKDTKLINNSVPDFPLVMSVINSRLAYKNSIELEENKSGQFIVSNTDNNLSVAEAKTIFNKTESKFEDALTYTLKNQTVVPSLLAIENKNAKVDSDFIGIDINNTLGFKGIDALPSGKDALDVSSADALELVTEEGKRTGFIVDEKVVTDPEDIRFTDKDKKKVEISYYTSLLPIYNEFTIGTGEHPVHSLSFDNMNINLDILQNVAYTKDETLYAEAIKYFTEKDSPILIKVTNDWARNYYIDEGLKYVDTEEDTTPTGDEPKA